ncbi:MAG: LysM peptidoglycan-binding domain-containing protein [Treponema sp.]|nr:LysM peptidoglycan-binding domain-containing protein [Treponema sp.]
MKKICLALATLIAVISLVACKSAQATQEDIDKSFYKVYTDYVELVNLDGAESYTVESGDTLTAICKKLYGAGNGYYFPLIMMVSTDTVLDPDLIEPGMILTIPNFDINITNKDQAKKLKPYFKEVADVYKLKTTASAPDIRENLLAISESLGE